MPHHTESNSARIAIPEKDLRVDVYRSSGAGGQNANKTNSAVRVVHIPTGMMVCIQEERNQQQNRVRALAILQARLLQLQRKSSDTERQKLRQGQIGNAERSDKIRTYNFPQGRITDHRANHSIYSVNEFMRNGEGLDQFIDRLKLQEEALKIEQLESKLQ
jgi:peptide chain release factor 1